MVEPTSLEGRLLVHLSRKGFVRLRNRALVKKGIQFVAIPTWK